MKNNVDPKRFWENKILEWERGRYDQGSTNQSFLEGLANRSSNSLRFRLHVSKELLRPFVQGKLIVEIGCGSGLLAEDLLSMGAKGYLGYDISENAISAARERVKDSKEAAHIQFEVCSVVDLPPLSGDIVISLGLLDWLNDGELDALFAASRQMDFLHAIAEKRKSMAQRIHRAYVHIAYGHKTNSYVPRYFSIDQIHQIISRYNPRPLNVFRDKRLSFGALVSSLPIANRDVS